MLTQISLVSAFLNVKGDLEFGEGISEYGKIEIRDWLGLSSLAELELKKNTFESCSDCSAEIEIIMYQDGILIDDVKFVGGYIKGYEFYIKTGTQQYDVNDYETQCSNGKYISNNDSYEQVCSRVITGSHKETENTYKTYNLGGEVEGNKSGIKYYINLEGRKHISQEVDWQITSQGKLIDEWALWGAGSQIVAYYPLNETTGSVGLSYPQPEHNLSLPAAVSWRNGILDGGVFLSGSAQRGNMNGLNLDLNETQEFSVSLWFNSTGGNDQVLMWSEEGGTAKVNIFLELSIPADTLHFFQDDVISDITTQTDIDGGFDFQTNTWYHLVIVTNFSGAYSYINGNFGEKLTTEGNNNPWIVGSSNMSIGGRSITVPDLHYTGEMDEIQVFNRTLTPEEVTELFNEGIPTNPLIEITTTLNSPADNNENLTGTEVLFNCSALSSASSTIVNISLWTNQSGTWVLNETEDFTGIGGIKNTSVFTKIIAETFDWTCKAFNSNGVSSIASPNRTINVVEFIEDNFDFNSSVLESSLQTFTLTITTNTGINIQNADLIYNGTIFTNIDRVLVSGNTFNLTKQITIPQITEGSGSQNKSFFFNITIVNEETGQTIVVESSIQNQTVTELVFGFCDGGDFDVPMLNFTFINEISGVEINATANATTFQATFLVGLDEDSLIKTFTVNNVSSNQSRYNFCTNKTTNRFITDMQLFYTADTFTDKNYFLNLAPLSNVTNEIDLFLIDEGIGIEFFIGVEQNLFSLTGATISIAKFFVGEGVFKTVEIDTTDGAGKITAFLDLNKDYKFTITKDGELLAIIEKRAICDVAPCELTLSITDETPDVYSGFSDIFASQVLYNLSFNPVTKIVTFDFVDITGLATAFRMDITKGSPNGTGSLISTQRLFTSSGSMTYNASDDSGDLTARVFIARSPDQLIDFITFIVNEVAAVLGILGLFVAFLIVITIIFGFAFSPKAFIFAIPLALTLIKLMGIISLSNGAIVVIYLLAIVAATFISR